jgi:hypothetical protein
MKKQKEWEARGFDGLNSEAERKRYLSGMGAGLTEPQSGPL